MWFVSSFDETVGRMTPDGITTNEFPAGTLPQFITTGPDHNLWITEQAPVCNGGPPGEPSAIGRLTPAGVHTAFALPQPPVACPQDIIVGPDGKLWFAEVLEGGNGAIGRIDPLAPNPAATIQTFPLAPGSGPGDLTLGPDGPDLVHR